MGCAQTVSQHEVAWHKVGVAATRVSFGRTGCILRGDECARLAENSDDPRHRSRIEAESRLWRQIALSEASQHEVRPKSKWAAHYE
jgi:hypothetical protein